MENFIVYDIKFYDIKLENPLIYYNSTSFVDFISFVSNNPLLD